MPTYGCPQCGYMALPQPVAIKEMSHRCPKKSGKYVLLKEVKEDG